MADGVNKPLEALRGLLDPDGPPVEIRAEWAEQPYYVLKHGEQIVEDVNLEYLLTRAAGESVVAE